MSNLLHIATVKTDPLIYVLSSRHFFLQTSFIGNFPTQYVIYQSAFRIENLTPNFFFLLFFGAFAKLENRAISFAVSVGLFT